MLRHVAYDVVLLDRMMPDMDGLDVLKRNRGQFSSEHLPVMMVTAKAHGEDVTDAIAAGVNDYVSKPVDLKRIAPRVAALVSRRRKSSSAET